MSDPPRVQDEPPQEFIVAEVSVNYSPTLAKPSNPLSRRFEEVIARNRERGYVLRDWRLAVALHEDHRNETIIAVFQREVR